MIAADQGTRQAGRGGQGRILPSVMISALAAALVASFLGPADAFTWLMEVAPVLLGAAALLVANARGFRLSRPTLVLLWLHALILIYGGAYTYAGNPLFERIREAFDLERNYYDRLGHFVQGFVPALLVREVLLRTSPLRPGKWLFFLVTCSALAFSAAYELIEWWTAAAKGASAEAFLGTQGDEWDAQWDMFLALLGAVASQLTLARVQDRALARSGR